MDLTNKKSGLCPLLAPSVRCPQMVCVCVCVCVVDGMNLKYALRWHIHIYQFIPYTRILKPFQDSEPTGLKVDITCC